MIQQIIIIANPPIHHSKPNQRSIQQHTYQRLITNYKNNKNIQSREKSVQSLNNKLESVIQQIDFTYAHEHNRSNYLKCNVLSIILFKITYAYNRLDPFTV